MEFAKIKAKSFFKSPYINHKKTPKLKMINQIKDKSLTLFNRQDLIT